MPTYEYKCEKCGKIYEDLVQGIKDMEHCTISPCCSVESKRILSVARVFVKGGTKTFYGNSDDKLHPSLEGIPLGEVPGDEDYIGKDLDDPITPKP